MKRIFLILPFVFMSIFSCASYKMPVGEQPANIEIIGNYYCEDIENNLQLNIYLYEDGYFYEAAFYTDENIIYSDLGSYKYNINTGEINFYYTGDSSKYNYIAQLSDDSTMINSEGDICNKIQNRSDLVQNYSIEEILGTYVMIYDYDEKTIVKLTLYDDGTFKENNIYPNSEEMWTETGIYDFFQNSGFISFRYNDWEDGDFSGILHPKEGILHSVEGEYVKIDLVENHIDNTDYFDKNFHIPK